jgi:hypothetical protein
MKYLTKFAAVGVVLAGTVITAPAATAAPTAPAQANFACTFDVAGTVTGDAVRVHTAPSLSSPAIGQIVGRTAVAWCTTSKRGTPGGRQWVFATGSGFNNRGRVILNGWIDMSFVRLGR